MSPQLDGENHENESKELTHLHVYNDTGLSVNHIISSMDTSTDHKIETQTPEEIAARTKILETQEYESVHPFSDGLCKVKKDGKYGYVNLYGEEVIPCKYLRAGYFRDSAAWVEITEGKRICIDRHGNNIFANFS